MSVLGHVRNNEMVFRSGNKGKQNAFCTAHIFGVTVNCVTTTTRCYVSRKSFNINRQVSV